VAVAVKVTEREAKAGNPSAINNLGASMRAVHTPALRLLTVSFAPDLISGAVHLKGWFGWKQDEFAAFQCFTQAKKLGCTAALNNCALCKLVGAGCRVDQIEGRSILYEFTRSTSVRTRLIGTVSSVL
jgi:hypothetical protein